MITEEDGAFINEILCTCSGTTRGQMIQLFVNGFDIEAISRKTGALSGCGGCEWDVAELLKSMQKVEQNNEGKTS